MNAYTDIHALSAIRTHDSSVQVSEDSSCLRPRSHSDWLLLIYSSLFLLNSVVIWNCIDSRTYIHTYNQEDEKNVVPGSTFLLRFVFQSTIFSKIWLISYTWAKMLNILCADLSSNLCLLCKCIFLHWLIKVSVAIYVYSAAYSVACPVLRNTIKTERKKTISHTVILEQWTHIFYNDFSFNYFKEIYEN
jgi:hypothetical protein